MSYDNPLKLNACAHYSFVTARRCSVCTSARSAQNFKLSFIFHARSVPITRSKTCARMQTQTRSITTICINCICICAHNVAKIPLAKLPYRSYLRSRLLSRVSVFKRDALMCTCVRDNVATANSHLRATRCCISPRKSLRIARIMTPHFAASGRAS